MGCTRSLRLEGPPDDRDVRASRAGDTVSDSEGAESRAAENLQSRRVVADKSRLALTGNSPQRGFAGRPRGRSERMPDGAGALGPALQRRNGLERDVAAFGPD